MCLIDVTNSFTYQHQILMIISIVMVCSGMRWLISNPNIIVSQRRQNLLSKSIQYLGITGITLFMFIYTLQFLVLFIIFYDLV
jgi:hypothetical protein